ncbi:DUF61 family protein [Methanocaldococcus infernus]|uniref:UPF0216 protein Metin_0404 n=1 Tax=Methanocaldococcus infernus (strain DSM 11812 / JCM 15783 / ME) TaxID=573063 RepID=D5VR71_METIM|nr:Protein of unknown function DUF61 [Methanocaldococcus infernus ME]
MAMDVENIVRGLIKETSLRVKRKTLGELLNEEKPHVIINNKRHRIKRRELELLKEISELSLKLPIVLEYDMVANAIVVKGKEEVKVIKKILGKEVNIFDDDNILYIYKPELLEVRKKLPTATQLIFRFSL